MKVLIVGASGFIGGHAAKAISAAGHQVVPSGLDFAVTLVPELWFGELEGIDAVVNAAGIFRETASATFAAVSRRRPMCSVCRVRGGRDPTSHPGVGARCGSTCAKPLPSVEATGGCVS